MPLPIGIWTANVNGMETVLRIESLDQQGIFIGQLNNAPIRGYWEEGSQTITFTAVAVGGFLPNIALFKGHLFRSPPNPEPGRDVTAMLTGSIQTAMSNFQLAPGDFDNFAVLPSGSSRRNVFGWMAQITEVV